ncbi:hypothetical protein NDU88_002979 [Pleurodeles waltl]|uniref:Uncharacterized protein n=1 Tax=Pleurodeles waltl TaxID=8319 RepID=A0AAV7QBG9_PLEWA|nr:hypothetical protein NDU88_002979 [Pleurodeles waltl]
MNGTSELNGVKQNGADLWLKATYLSSSSIYSSRFCILRFGAEEEITERNDKGKNYTHVRSGKITHFNGHRRPCCDSRSFLKSDKGGGAPSSCPPLLRGLRPSAPPAGRALVVDTSARRREEAQGRVSAEGGGEEELTLDHSNHVFDVFIKKKMAVKDEKQKCNLYDH